MLKKSAQWLLVFISGTGLGWYWHDNWRSSTDTVVAQKPGLSVHEITNESIDTRDEGSTEKHIISDGNLLDLLQQGQYDKAIQLYSELASTSSDTSQQRYKKLIIQHADNLKNDKSFSRAIKLLSVYIEHEFRDVEGRELLADVYHLQQNYLSEINILYEAKAYAYRTSSQERIINRIRAAVSTYRSQLHSNNDFRGLRDLYERLTQYEPDYPSHFIGLAEAKLLLQDYSGSRQSLSLVMYDPRVSNEVDFILAKIDEANPPTGPLEVTGVQLLRQGNHFLVDALINNQTQIRLLIDTGASLTMIKPDVLERSGIDLSDTYKTGHFNTANGLIVAPVFQINGLTVGDRTLNNLEVGAVELAEMPDIDGLLGMNYLKHFQFYIDQQQNLLRLTNKSIVF